MNSTRPPGSPASTTRRRRLQALAGVLVLPALTLRVGQSRAQSLATPPPAQLQYEVFLGDYLKGSRVAEMSQRFELSEGRYRLQSESQAKGLLALVWRGSLVQTSEGLVDSNGLRPTRYEERRGDRAPRGATIDPASGQVRFLGGEQAAAGAGVQDKLSALVQLGLLVAAGAGEGRPMPAGHSFEFPLLRTSRVAPARWRIEGVEDLQIGSSAVRATRVRQVTLPGDDAPAIDAWYESSRAPWALRVRIAEPDGQTLDQIVQRAN
jgi:hypothetical protein